MDNAEVFTPDSYRSQAADHVPQRRRKRKPPADPHIPSSRTEDFCWPGEDARVAHLFTEFIRHTSPSPQETIQETIARLISLSQSTVGSWRSFLEHLAVLVADVATELRLLESDEGIECLKQEFSRFERSTIRWMKWHTARNFRTIGERFVTTVGNRAYAILLLTHIPIDKSLFTPDDFVYLESIRDVQRIDRPEYEALNPVVLIPLLCPRISKEHVESWLAISRRMRLRSESPADESTEDGEKGGASAPQLSQQHNSRDEQLMSPRGQGPFEPCYGLLELYPHSATPETGLTAPQDKLRTAHKDARMEIAERKHSEEESHHYPACDGFMAQAVQYLALANVRCEGPLGPLSQKLRNPVSERHLLRLRAKDANFKADVDNSLSLAVGYFAGTRNILISGQGQDWQLEWPSNKALLFLERITLPTDSYMWVHIQTFKAY